MGITAGPLIVMSMDEFGFLSEAGHSSAQPSYASGSRGAPPLPPTSSQRSYNYAQQDPWRPVHQSQPYGCDPRARHLSVQARPVHPAHPASGSSIGSETAEEPAVRAKRGSNLACLKCRAIKVKCWKSNPNDPRCARCNRLDLFCEFREHHRGKKLEKVIADESRNVVLSPDLLRRSCEYVLSCSSYPLNLSLASIGTPQGGAHMAAFQHYRGEGSTPESLSSRAIGMSAGDVYDDVVRTGACSWTDACYVFSLFVTQLNPVAALLEPSVHTVQFMREQSPILFSTMLGIASRFFRPDLSGACQAAAAGVLKCAAARKICSVDHMQALIVSLIWAAPGDASRDEMLASALAQAYELGLPLCFDAGVPVGATTKQYTPPMAPHVHAGYQATVLRMQQRTWMQLCLLELSQQSDAHGSWAKRPERIAHADFPRVRAWYAQHHATLGAYETRLAYLLDFALVQRDSNRLAMHPGALHGYAPDGSLSQSAEQLMADERECLTAWFTTYGDEHVPRYGLDRFGQAEASFVVVYYRFSRAVQLHALTGDASWYATATELAYKTLEVFCSKILEPEGGSMLRLSAQSMGAACLAAARWLLGGAGHVQERERARERISEAIRLLRQPQFYPDGNRVVVANELTGQLDQALRSVLGDAGMVVDAGWGGTSPKRSRAPGRAEQLYDTGRGVLERRSRKQARRNSNGSLARIELGSFGGGATGSEPTGSERGGSEWSDDAAGRSVDAGMNEVYWPPALLGTSGGDAGAWTPRSEGALSNMAMASSISPPTSASSAVFSVQAPSVPDPLDLGLGAGVAGWAYGYTDPTASSSTTMGAQTTPYDTSHMLDRQPRPNEMLSAPNGGPHLHGMFAAETGEPSGTVAGYGSNRNAHQPQAPTLHRNDTATPHSYGAPAAQTDAQLAAASALEASLTVGLSASYEASHQGLFDDASHGRQQQRHQ